MIVLLGVGDNFQVLTLQGLTMVGGRESSGVRLQGLKSKDDYGILSSDNGQVSVRPLKGSARDIVHLPPGRSLIVNDLRILVPPRLNESTKATAMTLLADLGPLMSRLADCDDMSSALGDLLRGFLERFQLDRGLVIEKTLSDEFQVTTEIGIDGSQPWLSESLIQAALQSSSYRYIGNIVSSEFASNRSLLATGFTSILSWPLIVRGEVLGAVIAGSHLPHSGLTEEERRDAGLMIQLAALFLNFHRRDQKLSKVVAVLRQRLKHDNLPLTTVDDELLKTCELASRVAPTPLSVLIHGETGCGKEVMARWLHAQSDRKGRPFIAVNCGSIPSELMESLLFGHRKGSFTGAIQDQVGKFQQAHGGTLFLDEIGDLAEDLQAKLLRVLQDRQVEPLGGQKPIPVDVRVLAASHKNLTTLVEMGRFRNDLYYRLAEVALNIPPLRKRPRDVVLLALEFLKEFAPEKRFSEQVWRWLEAQAWPGNVRELRTAVKRGALLSRHLEVEIEDLLAGLPGTGQQSAGCSWLGGRSLDEARDRFVIEKVTEALRRADGKRALAAELLGINQRTLFRYLESQRGDRASD